MAVSEGYLSHVLERLTLLGEVVHRKMFGGVGLYHDGLFFALIGGDALYLKVNDTNRSEFEAAGMPAFHNLSYYEVPPEVLEDDTLLVEWAGKALAVAAEASGAQKRTRETKAKTGPGSTKGRSELSNLPNLGAVSAGWLEDAGIHSIKHLQEMGSVAAYQAVQRSGKSPSLLLLYALEAALMGLRWDHLPEAVKSSLRQRAGLE
jgi:DNA transformation protein